MDCPVLGTRISLYFPNYDEKAAIAVNCVRTNGGSCAGMSNPAKRSFVSEHGKELNLYPEQMGFVGGAKGNILLEDQTGISLTTEKKIQIIGKSVSFEAPKVFAAAPASELLLSKQEPMTGQPISSLTMNNQFDFKTKSQTVAMGSNEQTFDAYNDAPKEVEQEPFDWGGLLGNVLAGLAVVAAVAFVLATAGAGVAVVAGAVVGGCVAVGVCAVGDILSGQVSSLGDYIFAALVGAVTGAVDGAIGASKFAKGLGKLGKISLELGMGFTDGFASNLAGQLWQGKSLFDLDFGEAFGEGWNGLKYSGAAIFGVGIFNSKYGQQIFNGTKNMFGKWGSKVGDVFSNISNKTGKLGSKLGDVFSSASNQFSRLLSKAYDEVKALPMKIAGALCEAGKWTRNKLSDALGSFKNSIDDLKNNFKGNRNNPSLSPKMEQKILGGERIPGKNAVRGGHSPNVVNNANPDYAVQILKQNPDGTLYVQFYTQFPCATLSKLKKSTLFQILGAIKIL